MKPEPVTSAPLSVTLSSCARHVVDVQSSTTPMIWNGAESPALKPAAVVAASSV